MNKPINKTCPHCQLPFLARRKNQRYCTDECRHDANNTVAKQRYASFRQEAPKLEDLQKQVKKLEEKLASLIIVIQGIKVTEDTVTYGGHRYKRRNRMDRTGVGVRLDKGIALLMPGGQTILYRADINTREIYYEFVLDR